MVVSIDLAQPTHVVHENTALDMVFSSPSPLKNGYNIPSLYCLYLRNVSGDDDTFPLHCIYMNIDMTLRDSHGRILDMLLRGHDEKIH